MPAELHFFAPGESDPYKVLPSKPGDQVIGMAPTTLHVYEFLNFDTLRHSTEDHSVPSRTLVGEEINAANIVLLNADGQRGVTMHIVWN